MARLINSQTQVVVNVADDMVERLGPLYKPVQDKASAKAPSKPSK